MQIDPTDPSTIYVESQDGNVNRLDLATGRTASIRPRAPQAAPAGAAAGSTVPGGTQAGFGGGLPNVVPAPPAGEAFRFYWNTPILISPHNPRTVYAGGNRLFKSTNRGDTWTMTPDLTRGARSVLPADHGRGGRRADGLEARRRGQLQQHRHDRRIARRARSAVWVGTNDGNLQVSRDGGATWKNVVDSVPGVPKETHVSRVEPSHFDAATCYASFDGHRTDDHRPYVYVTRDFGATWTALAGNLPAGNVNTIREDPKNRSLLYAGTEYGFHVSMNGGKSWTPLMAALPTVRIDDVLVHPRDNDLVLATHGRSIWIMDDITALQQINDEVLAADVYLFPPRAAVAWRTDPTLSRTVGGSQHFRGENPPRGTAISYYLKAVPPTDVKITITDITGRVVRELSGTKAVGLNRVLWNLTGTPVARPGGGRQGGAGGFGGQSVEPGTYLVTLTASGKTLETTVVVAADEPDR